MDNWTGYIILSDNSDGTLRIEKSLRGASLSKARNELNALIVSCLNWGPDDNYKLMRANIDEKESSVITYLDQLSENDVISDYDKIHLLLNYVENTEFPSSYIDDIQTEGISHQIKEFSYEDIAKILDIDINIVQENLDLESWNNWWTELLEDLSEDE